MDIKIRQWDKKNKVMLYPCSLSGVVDFYNTKYKDMDGAEAYERFMIDHDFMLWTGMEDKNGRMIWDGDICTEDNDNDVLIQIKWYDNHAWGCHILKSKYVLVRNQIFPLWQYGRNDGSNGNRRLIVIGNIYENPELLEATNDQ